MYKLFQPAAIQFIIIVEVDGCDVKIMGWLSHEIVYAHANLNLNLTSCIHNSMGES
jgi:hypothetical protein